MDEVDEYTATTGLELNTYLGRWLLISGAMFLISGLIYALRLRRGLTEPGPMLAPAAADAVEPPVSLPWRIGSQSVLGGAALAFLWVAAALVVGLLTTGFGP